MNDEPVLIGQDFDESSTVFELRLWDHLNRIDPAQFGLIDVPTLNPETYYVTSGDAICKTTQLCSDLWVLIGKIKKTAGKKPKKKYKQYLGALYSCAFRSRALIHKLTKARGSACFLETEWRSGVIIAIAKNPRPKPVKI